MESWKHLQFLTPIQPLKMARVAGLNWRRYEMSAITRIITSLVVVVVKNIVDNTAFGFRKRRTVREEKST